MLSLLFFTKGPLVLKMARGIMMAWFFAGILFSTRAAPQGTVRGRGGRPWRSRSAVFAWGSRSAVYRLEMVLEKFRTVPSRRFLGFPAPRIPLKRLGLELENFAVVPSRLMQVCLRARAGARVASPSREPRAPSLGSGFFDISHLLVFEGSGPMLCLFLKPR